VEILLMGFVCVNNKLLKITNGLALKNSYCFIFLSFQLNPPRYGTPIGFKMIPYCNTLGIGSVKLVQDIV
jgi:hypothetical protein